MSVCAANFDLKFKKKITIDDFNVKSLLVEFDLFEKNQRFFMKKSKSQITIMYFHISGKFY